MSAKNISDSKILLLVGEPKKMDNEWRETSEKKKERLDKKHILKVNGELGNEFKIIIRERLKSALPNFSVILGYCPRPDEVFRLRRYNSNDHEHKNKKENEKINGFHIHCATERYQGPGKKEDDYAEKTDRFQDMLGAIDCLFQDANIQVSHGELMEIKLWILGLLKTV